MSGSLLRISTAEAVVNYFKEKIAEGELKAGDRLPSERMLQDELGISRFALREGLARLNALGIITSAQGKASVINADVDNESLSNVFLPLSASEHDRYTEDLFASRRLIEAECAALAAAHYRAEDLVRLRDILEEMDRQIEDSATFANLDYDLHHTIARSGANLFLMKIHKLLQLQLSPVIAKSVSSLEHRRISMDWHRRIVDAIAAGDGEQARAMMIGHLSACKTAYEGEA